MMQWRECALFLLGVAMMAFAPVVAAQGKGAAERKAGGWRGTACGNGITLQVRPARVSQGTLVLAEVRSSRTLTGVTGSWNNREVAFWQDGLPAGSSKVDRWRGLLGVDLEKPAGTYELAVSVPQDEGDPLACRANVMVRVGRFPTENLRVENQFVEPSEEQAARAKDEQARLRAIYDTPTPEKLWKGGFRLPLDGIKTGGNFGRRRILNGKAGSPHSGVDFPVPTGTPVHAAQAGRVALAEALFFAGNTVVIDHGLGIYTFYGHLSEIDVKAGDRVEGGDLLGKVGATGRVTGPHLHWALSVNHARVNAMQIVSILGGR